MAGGSGFYLCMFVFLVEFSIFRCSNELFADGGVLRSIPELVQRTEFFRQ